MSDREQSGVKRAAVVRTLALVWSLVALAVAVPAAVADDPRDTLERYARATWASFVAMTDAETGLPADKLHIDGTRSVQTSITNINDKTFVDHGFPGCPDRQRTPDPLPSAYTNGVVTPHAAFLALRWAPAATLENLANLERDFDIYTDWGFRDSVNVNIKVVSDYYLALDQGMIMAALGNALAQDMLREAFATPEFQRALRPVIAIEAFNAGPGSHGHDTGMNISAAQP